MDVKLQHSTRYLVKVALLWMKRANSVYLKLSFTIFESKIFTSCSLESIVSQGCSYSRKLTITFDILYFSQLIGLSRSETAITRGNPIMLLPPTTFLYITCLDITDKGIGEKGGENQILK